MSKEVRLAEVTADNWEAVAELELRDDQEESVASNVYSLAESKFDPSARPRAIYAGKKIVGFLMYDLTEDDGPPHEASIYRFMIDKMHQGSGYGRAALEQAIEEIKRVPRVAKISICYMPDNAVAKRFYASFGFVEIGTDEDGEVIAGLAL
jgi:diamine N-acetyltransferase